MTAPKIRKHQYMTLIVRATDPHTYLKLDGMAEHGWRARFGMPLTDGEYHVVYFEREVRPTRTKPGAK